MKRAIIGLGYATMLGLGLGVALAAAAAAQELPLKRVMLSTGGVGYFEHEAEVEGNAVLELEVRLDQVDDVLKSIVVYDDRGGVGDISLPGRAPLAQVFRDLPFGPQALRSPVALLNALQGAEVEAVGARALRGRLLRVVPEVRELPHEGGRVTRHRVSLLTADGIQQFILEDAESLRFVDPELTRQVERALAAIAAHRARDKRTLRLSLVGEGRRVVRVAYVVAAPLWKATYRLTLEADEPERGLLHGWAVIENMSGRDWREVELTLLSGNPVTFRQALYSAYYVDRPSVPVEVLGRILPRADTGAVAGDADGGFALREEEGRRRAGRAGAGDARFRALAKSETEAMVGGMAQKPTSLLAPGAPAPAPAMEMARVAAAVSEEAATQVVFRLPRPVSVASGRSLMVPIVDRVVPARRVSLYQPETHPIHPLATVRLENDGETGLPPGVLTLYERGAGRGSVAYVGDARLNTLPRGEERLLSFALDQRTRIDREVRQSRTVVKAAIDRGVLRLTVARGQTTVYRLKAPAKEARELLIEVPRRADWKLVSPDEKTVEVTERYYRIAHRLAAGSEETLIVETVRPLVEEVRIDGLVLQRLLAYARSTELGEEVRAALAKAADLRRAVDRHQRRLERLEKERRVIFEEQRRIRDNLNRVPRDGDLFRRYLKKLDGQEDAIERIAGESEETTAALAAAREALARYIRDLKV